MFTRNYPHRDGNTHLLSVPERTHAHEIGFTGRGVVMAFIDSGFYPHPDIRDRVLMHADATEPTVTEWTRYTLPQWYSWHGQMTTVIAAGDGRSTGGRYRGLASEAELVLVKVTNLQKRLKEADILRGLNWVLENRERFNIRIVNLSVGGDHPSDDPDHPLHVAVRELTEAGVVVLVAAGNSGEESLVPPASAAEAITVGGYDDLNITDPTKWIGYNNNYATVHDAGQKPIQKPEVIATARWIASPVLPGTKTAREMRYLAMLLKLGKSEGARLRRILAVAGRELGITAGRSLRSYRDHLQAMINKHKVVDSRTQHVDGTSVSVAIASSVVAILLEANPTLTPAQVKAILMQSAKPLRGIPPEKQGAGVIDVTEALMMAKELIR
jgi:serine protease AprX